MKKLYLILLVLLLSIGTISAQVKLTLEKSIQIALQRNPILIKTANSLRGNKATVKSAYGNLMPNLSLSGGWSWNKNKDKGGTQTDFFGNIIELPPSEVDSRLYSLSVGGSVVLFDGLSNYAYISKSEGEYESAQYNLFKLKQDIVLQTTNYYFSVIGEGELLKVRDENVKYNEKLLEQIKERNRLGSVSIADVYTQEVQLGNARVQYITQKNIFEKAKNTLLTYLALNVMDEYDFEKPIRISNKKDVEKELEKFGPVEDMIKKALANRFDYKSQLKNVENQYQALRMSRGGFYPSLTGNYSYSTNAVNPTNLFNRQIFRIGLNLRVPIFSNFNTETQVEYSKIAVANAQEDLRDLERQIRVQIKQGWLDLLAAKEALIVSYENVKSATENRKINDERYSLGAGTILDVLQASRDYQDAQQNLINSAFYFFTTHDRLLNLMGALEFEKYEVKGE
ncbi:MAG: TolC family protein [Chlorobi bacterium]|nr:TolC family protein [Chlorobiota bacterium]